MLYPNCPYIFFRNGKKIKSYYTAWNNAFKRAGIKKKRFHSLRHTALTNMTRVGIPTLVSKKISGHKTDAVFERYNIVNEADLKEAAEKLSRRIEDRQTNLSRKAVEKDLSDTELSKPSFDMEKK